MRERGETGIMVSPAGENASREYHRVPLKRVTKAKHRQSSEDRYWDKLQVPSSAFCSVGLTHSVVAAPSLRKAPCRGHSHQFQPSSAAQLCCLRLDRGNRPDPPG